MSSSVKSPAQVHPAPPSTNITSHSSPSTPHTEKPGIVGKPLSDFAQSITSPATAAVTTVTKALTSNSSRASNSRTNNLVSNLKNHAKVTNHLSLTNTIAGVTGDNFLLADQLPELRNAAEKAAALAVKKTLCRALNDRVMGEEISEKFRNLKKKGSKLGRFGSSSSSFLVAKTTSKLAMINLNFCDLCRWIGQIPHICASKILRFRRPGVSQSESERARKSNFKAKFKAKLSDLQSDREPRVFMLFFSAFIATIYSLELLFIWNYLPKSELRFLTGPRVTDDREQSFDCSPHIIWKDTADENDGIFDRMEGDVYGWPRWRGWEWDVVSDLGEVVRDSSTTNSISGNSYSGTTNLNSESDIEWVRLSYQTNTINQVDSNNQNTTNSLLQVPSSVSTARSQFSEISDDSDKRKQRFSRYLRKKFFRNYPEKYEKILSPTTSHRREAQECLGVLLEYHSTSTSSTSRLWILSLSLTSGLLFVVRSAAMSYMTCFVLGRVVIREPSELTNLSDSENFDSEASENGGNCRRFSWYQLWLLHTLFIGSLSLIVFFTANDPFKRFVYSIRECERYGLSLYVYVAGPRRILRTACYTRLPRKKKYLWTKRFLIGLRVTFAVTIFICSWCYTLSFTLFNSSLAFRTAVTIGGFGLMAVFTGLVIYLERKEERVSNEFLRATAVMSSTSSRLSQKSAVGTGIMPTTVPGTVDQIQETEAQNSDLTLTDFQNTLTIAPVATDYNLSKTSDSSNPRATVQDAPGLDKHIDFIHPTSRDSENKLSSLLTESQKNSTAVAGMVGPNGYKLFICFIPLYYILIHAVVYTRTLRTLISVFGRQNVDGPLFFLSWLIAYSIVLAAVYGLWDCALRGEEGSLTTLLAMPIQLSGNIFGTFLLFRMEPFSGNFLVSVGIMILFETYRDTEFWHQWYKLSRKTGTKIQAKKSRLVNSVLNTTASNVNLNNKISESDESATVRELEESYRILRWNIQLGFTERASLVIVLFMVVTEFLYGEVVATVETSEPKDTNLLVNNEFNDLNPLSSTNVVSRSKLVPLNYLAATTLGSQSQEAYMTPVDWMVAEKVAANETTSTVTVSSLIYNTTTNHNLKYPSSLFFLGTPQRASFRELRYSYEDFFLRVLALLVFAFLEHLQTEFCWRWNAQKFADGVTKMVKLAGNRSAGVKFAADSDINPAQDLSLTELNSELVTVEASTTLQVLHFEGSQEVRPMGTRGSQTENFAESQTEVGTTVTVTPSSLRLNSPTSNLNVAKKTSAYRSQTETNIEVAEDLARLVVFQREEPNPVRDEDSRDVRLNKLINGRKDGVLTSTTEDNINNNDTVVPLSLGEGARLNKSNRAPSPSERGTSQQTSAKTEAEVEAEAFVVAVSHDFLKDYFRVHLMLWVAMTLIGLESGRECVAVFAQSWS